MIEVQPSIVRVMPWGAGIAVIGSFQIEKGKTYTIQTTEDGITWNTTGTTQQHGSGTGSFSMFLATEVLAPWSRLVLI